MTRAPTLPLLVAALLGAAPALAQAEPEELSEEDRAAIEEALGEDARVREDARPPAQERPGALQSMNPQLSLIGAFAFAWFRSEDPLQTGGHDPTQNGFNLQGLELAFGSAVDPYFRFDANLVFGQFGVEIEEAYATTLALPWRLQARLGQFLTRFGRFNPTHLHAWHFVDQPFATGRVFGSEGNRGLGGEVSWLAPLPWYLELVGSVTDATGEATARSFLGGSGFTPSGPLDFQLTGAVKQFHALGPTWSLLWGLSAANGPNGTGHANRTDVYGVDAYLKYRPLSSADPTVLAFQTEWFYRRRQVPGDLLQDLSGYAYVSWRFAQRWGTAARYELGTPAVGLAGRIADDPLDPEWAALRHRVSANVTFWPTEFSRLRLQGATDLVGWRGFAPEWSLMLAVEFSIGAHGSHTF